MKTGSHAIVVAGMHRSGTSALTRVISLLGAQLPDNLMPASADFNASGFWESVDIADFNDALLAALQSRWDDVLPVDLQLLTSTQRAQFEDQARLLLQSNFAKTDLFVLKDPRMGRLLPFWLPVIRSQSITPSIVIPFRHPLEVAASLHRRDGFSEQKSIYLWLRHMLDVERHTRGLARSFVSYEGFLSDWRATVAAIQTELKLQFPVSIQDAATAIDDFLQPKLRHHTVATPLVPADEPINRHAASLYQQLISARDLPPSLTDEINVELSTIERLFAPLVRDISVRLDAAQATADQAILARVQLQGELTAAHEAFARLQAEFEIKCCHILETETLLTSEREMYRQLQQEFVARCSQIELLQEDRDSLQAALATRSGELTAAQHGNERLQAEFDVKCHHLAQTVALLSAEREIYRQLQREFDAKCKHIELLQQESDDLQTALAERASAEMAVSKELENLRTIFVGQTEQLSDLKTALAKEQALRKKNLRESAELNNLLAERSFALSALGEEFADLQTLFSDQSGHVVNLEKTLATEQGRCRKLQQECGALQISLTECTSQLAATRKALAGSDSQVQALYKAVDRLQTTVEGITADHATADDLVAEMLAMFRKSFDH